MPALTKGQKISLAKTGIPRDEATKERIRATKIANLKLRVMLIDNAQELVERAKGQSKIENCQVVLERLTGVLDDLRALHPRNT